MSPDAQVRLKELADRYGFSPHQRAQMQTLLRMLARDRRAPTAVRSPERAVDTHLADSLVALELEAVRTARTIADLGSGAGFPGLPLAIALESSEVRLVESQAWKCVYLEGASAEAGLTNVRVVGTRVEEWRAGEGEHDLVLARALGAQPLVVEYAAPLLRLGGVLVDWRGGSVRGEEEQAARAAEQLGMRRLEIRRVEPFAAAQRRHLHLYMKVSETPPEFPRRAGVARRKPLGS